MKIIKDVDFIKETIDMIYKINLSKDSDKEYEKELLNTGIDNSTITEIFKNYNKFKSNFKNEITIPDKLIPFYTMSIDNSSIFRKLYVNYKHSQRIDYITFINRFYEVDLSLEEKYSESLEFNDILNIVNNLDIDDKDKLNLINFYTGGERLFKELLDTVEKASVVLKKYYYIIEEEVKESYLELHENNTLPNLLKEYFDGNEIYSDDVEVYISITDYNYLFHSIIDNKHYIYIGYLVIKLNNIIQQNRNNEENALNTIKSISDATRYKILKILANKKTYGNDIANLLSLSAATINHHLNILINNQLLKVSFDPLDNKKVFYELNKERLEQVLDTIRSNLI